jgi:CBS domain containing-hemolysin-like protein
MEMPYVPETLNVYDLMVRMNKLRLSIACVVDEFGGTFWHHYFRRYIGRNIW